MNATTTRTTLRPGPLALIVIATVTACGGEPEGNAAPSGTLDGPDAPITATVEDHYRVGAFDGGEWETFGNVEHVAFDAMGRLFILDSDVPHVVVLNPDGTHSHTIGKRGGGPGEFQSPMSMTVFRDGSMAVYDMGQQGFQLFNPEGTYVDNVPLDLSKGIPGFETYPEDGGTVLSSGGMRMRSGEDHETEEPQGRRVDRFALDSSERSLAYMAWEPPPSGEGEEASLGGEGGGIQIQMNRLRAFDPALHIAPLPGGFVAVVDSTGYRVKIVDPAGDIAGVIERPILPVTVDDDIRGQERERRLAELEEQTSGNVRVFGAGSGSMSVDPEAITRMRRSRIENMIFSAEVPVIAGLGTDSEGRLWIERAGAVIGSNGPIDIVAADGTYWGTLDPDGPRIPEAFGPGGLAAYVETDELGVETVRVKRVHLPMN